MATSINLGTFSDSWSGVSYTCYLIYDSVTRSGDNITISNVKARIVSQSGYGTEGRMGVSLNIPSGTSRVSNATLAASYTYPTDTTYTISSSGYTFSNLTTTFTYSISFSDTGYGTTWNSTYSKNFSGSISCPARTYTVSYNANGGTGAPSNQSKTYNVSLTLSSTAPTRDGYIFLGWGTTASTTTPSYQPGSSYTGNADLALYAVWEEIPEPDIPDIDIDFEGIWIRNTSKLSTILKNLVLKLKRAIASKEPITNEEIDALFSDTMNVQCANGYIVSGNSGLTGYGTAVVRIIGNIAKIDFAFNATQSGGNDFVWGLNSIRMNSINPNIPATLTPLGTPCGVCTYYYGGYVYGNLTGFGGTVNALSGYPHIFLLGRIYDNSGSNGGWPENAVPANTYIVGTCYGKIT